MANPLSWFKSLLSGIGDSILDLYRGSAPLRQDTPTTPPTPPPSTDSVHQETGRVITIETPQNSEEGIRTLNSLRYQRRVIDESVEMATSFLQMRLREFMKQVQNNVTGKIENVPMYRAELYTNASAEKAEGIRARLDSELFGGQGQSQSGDSYISNAVGQPPTAGMQQGGNMETRRLWRLDTNVQNKRSRAALRALEHREGAEVQINNDTGDTSIYALPGRDKRSRELRSTVQGIVDVAHDRDQTTRDLLEPYTERMRKADFKRFNRDEARAQNMREFIKKNPGSSLARNVKKATRARRAASLKSGAGRAIALVAAGVMMIISVLQKILAGVLEQAAYLRKQQTDAANYNLSTSQMQQYTLLEKALQLDKGTVSNIFGNLMRFSDPTQPGFVNGIDSAATLLQKDTGDLTKWIQGKIHDPEAMMYDLLADILNATASGRGGTRPGLSTSEAFSVNMDLARQAFGDKFAALLQRMYEQFGQTDIRDHGATFTAAEIKGKAESVVPSNEGGGQTLLDAAQKGVAALGQLAALWTDLKNTVFNPILAHMSELVAMLRNLARTVFGKDNPGFATSEQMAAEAVAMEAIPRIEGNIRANVDDVRPYMAKSKIRVTDPEEYAREVYRVVADKDTEGLKNLGLSPIELITLAAENGFLFKNIQKLDELNQNASVKMGDLEDQRPHTGGTSDAEMANAGNEFGYTTLAWLRKIVNDDVKSMYDMSVVGNADLLAAFSGGILKSGVDVFGPGGDYTSGTREINKRQRQTLKELADNAQVFQEETGIAPRSTYMLRRVNRVISKHEAVDMAVPELRNEGITAEDIQGVVAYIQAARQHTTASMQAEKNPFNREKLRTKATYLEDLGRVMQNVAQYIPVPGFTPEGSANAHAILLRGQQENAWKQISSAVRTEVATEIMRQTGMSRKDAEAAYLANSRGTVSPSEGSSRELKFHAIIDVPNMDSKLEVSGTVNNSGGLDDVHTLVDGNIYLEAPSPVR